MRFNRLTRPPALLATAACLALVACGGGDEAPDTQVVVPDETAEPASAADPFPSQDGFLVSADERRVVLRTQEGEQKYRVSVADIPALGIAHLQSHAGLTDIGFRVFFDEIQGKRFIKGAIEIPPPF